MPKIEKDTELKIKEAAKNIFHEKGFAATKTRDIAEAAGMNLALLNYYFRSKKKLYDLIMVETLQEFFGEVTIIMNREETSLDEKLEQFVAFYIDKITENPDVPLFIINESRQNPKDFFKNLSLSFIQESVFLRQFQEEIKAGKMLSFNPLHIMMNVASLTIFPFLATPMIGAITKIDPSIITEVIQERKQLIPKWIKAMLITSATS